jgi:hypothetical protein
MKQKITLIALLLSLTAVAQKPFDQYSFEAEYGFNVSGNPTIMDFAHWGVSFRYMMERDWGIKFDFAKDEFTDADGGTNYTRVSVQVVNNLGRTLNSMTMNGDKLGMLAHGGIGWSSLTSNSHPGTDNILHVIIGLTPQYKLTDSFAIYVDAAYIANFTQHFTYDGFYPNGTGTKEAFTGSMINASVGISYYFGQGGSRADWNFNESKSRKKKDDK